VELDIHHDPLGAYVIHVDGSTAPLFRPTGDGAWLTAMQSAVGGYLELVGIPGLPHLCLLVDEDGLSKNLAENRSASNLAGQRIVGTALVLPRALLD